MRHLPLKPIIFVSILVCGLAGCGVEDRTEPESQEGEHSPTTGTVRLSKESQAKIGIEAVQARRVALRETISTTGWLQVKPGNEVVVRAAATGFYLPNSEHPDFDFGSLVESGHRFGSLKVFVSPQEEAQLVAAKEEVDILINQSRVTRELAEGQLNRLQNATEGIVAGTRLLELQEIVQRSKVAEQEARDKLPFLPKEPYDHQLDLKGVVLTAPIAGRITKLHVSPRQLVIQGDPLWTIADWSQLWVRVPVFEADRQRILQDESASVPRSDGTDSIAARPIQVAQPTEAGRRTVDVFYEIENHSVELRPGQAVSIDLPTGHKSERIVIPRTAIVWDGMGNPWVYVKEDEELFRRQRVDIRNTPEGIAVNRGLDDEDSVVSVGAQALYGEEFSGQIQAEDDD